GLEEHLARALVGGEILERVEIEDVRAAGDGGGRGLIVHGMGPLLSRRVYPTQIRASACSPRALRCSPRGFVTAVSAEESGGTEAWRGGVRTRVEDKRRRSRLSVRVRADDPSPPCLGSASLLSADPFALASGR